MAKTVVGLMDNMAKAQEVVRDLESSGFDRGSINLIAKHGETGTTGTSQDFSEEKSSATMEGAKKGAGAGAAVGGLAGFVAGLTAISIPGIGPALALGPLGSALAGAGVGAVAGGGIGALMKMGVPEKDAHYYMEGVKRGGTLVAVTCPDDRVDQASTIMQRHGAIDIDRKGDDWRKEGWTGFQTEGHREEMRPHRISEGLDRPSGTTGRPATGFSDRPAEGMSRTSEFKGEGERVIPVMEEDVKVGKREVPGNLVRVYSHVESVPIQENVSLREEHATIERRPVDRPVSAAERDAFKEESMEIRETREEPVISKETRVKEEVVVGKESTQRMETINETERHTRVDVDQGGGTRHGMAATGLNAEDEDFRRHYQTMYGGKGDFDTYRSAYHYADEDTEMRRYQGRDFTEVEEDIHRSWDRTHPGGTWNQFKEAIRYGWNKKRHI